MKSPRLPVTRGACECSRRTMLQGLGAAAVGALVLDTACGQQGSSLPTATSTTCGSGQCIDLSDAANKDLTLVGGAMLTDTASDTIMVVRTSDNEVVALSAVCTHAGCTTDYNAAQTRIECACHGSQFSLTGAVLRGPAVRPLRIYQATFASNTITIT